ncbi:MAG: flagellar hook-length control protein FliK, partial [Betaproteobacteria bacterium]
SQPSALQAASAVGARGGETGTAQVAIQQSTRGLADAELAITSTSQATDATLLHAQAAEDDGQRAASSLTSASGMASHSSKGGAASAIELSPDAQMARSGMRASAAAGMNLQSAPTALAELDLGRMTKVALDPQLHANQTALRAEVLTTTNARASGWSDGVRQQLERARFAAVMPQAKQTATVDSIARLPMVESLLSSLGQQTSPGAKLGVEPVSLSSVKAGTQGLDPALLTQNGLQQSVTQSVTKGSQSLNPLYQGAVNARIEQTAWMAQIANHAKMAIKDDFRSVEIRLKPAHLGTIEILVSQDDEQTQLAFFTKHAQVREALEGQMPRLQKLFEEDGLKLGDAWVSDQSLAEHREHQTGTERDQDALTPPGFALDQRDAQVVASMTAQKVDSSAMLDVWA